LLKLSHYRSRFDGCHSGADVLPLFPWPGTMLVLKMEQQAMLMVEIMHGTRKRTDDAVTLSHEPKRAVKTNPKSISRR
jgi:hypothetical protein